MAPYYTSQQQWQMYHSGALHMQSRHAAQQQQQQQWQQMQQHQQMQQMMQQQQQQQQQQQLRYHHQQESASPPPPPPLPLAQRQEESSERAKEEDEKAKRLHRQFSRAIKLQDAHDATSEAAALRRSGGVGRTSTSSSSGSSSGGGGGGNGRSEYARAVAELPMTPSLASMTPRSRAVSVGQILLARALVSDVLGEELDVSALSSKALLAAGGAPLEGGGSAFFATVPEGEEIRSDDDDDDNDAEEIGMAPSPRPSRAHSNFRAGVEERAVKVRRKVSPRTVIRTPATPPNGQFLLGSGTIRAREALSPTSGEEGDRDEGDLDEHAAPEELDEDEDEDDGRTEKVMARAKKPSTAASVVVAAGISSSGGGSGRVGGGAGGGRRVLSPRSAKLLSKSDLQALINERISRSISERSGNTNGNDSAGNSNSNSISNTTTNNKNNNNDNSGTSSRGSSASPSKAGGGGDGESRSPTWPHRQSNAGLSAEEVAAAARRERRSMTRFNAVYRTPGGQAISFKDSGKNTPPTPKFGGDRVGAAVDVEWGAYEAVYASSPPLASRSWQVQDEDEDDEEEDDDADENAEEGWQKGGRVKAGELGIGSAPTFHRQRQLQEQRGRQPPPPLQPRPKQQQQQQQQQQNHHHNKHARSISTSGSGAAGMWPVKPKGYPRTPGGTHARVASPKWGGAVLHRASNSTSSSLLSSSSGGGGGMPRTSYKSFSTVGGMGGQQEMMSIGRSGDLDWAAAEELAEATVEANPRAMDAPRDPPLTHAGGMGGGGYGGGGDGVVVGEIGLLSAHVPCGASRGVISRFHFEGGAGGSIHNSDSNDDRGDAGGPQRTTRRITEEQSGYNDDNDDDDDDDGSSDIEIQFGIGMSPREFYR